MDMLVKDIQEICSYNEFSVTYAVSEDIRLMRQLIPQKFPEVNIDGTFHVYSEGSNVCERAYWPRKYVFELFYNQKIFLFLEKNQLRAKDDMCFVFEKGQEFASFLSVMYGFPYFVTNNELTSGILEGDTDILALYGEAISWSDSVKQRVSSLGYTWG